MFLKMDMSSFFLIMGLIMLMYSIYSFIMFLLGVEFIMLMMFMFFCSKVFLFGVNFEFMFIFVCMMVLEGVVGLCLLMKNYRFEGSNMFLSW